MSYSDYINSDGWKAKSNFIKESRGNKCQVCGVSGRYIKLETHHNNYDNIGKELDNDLVVLCEDCHSVFHKSGMKPGRKIVIDDNKILSILWKAGVTYTNNDPWYFYSLGKCIIDRLAEGDSRLYDKYNAVNIKIVDAACMNRDRREFKMVKETDDWGGYGSEYRYRCESGFWEGWKE